MNPLCKCGCGKEVTKPNNKYLMGHSEGGGWQNKYDKNSKEYKLIVEKIKKTTSESMKGIKKSKEHCNNISKGRKKWISENKNYFNDIIRKMTKTKQLQSENGILSKKHFVNNKTKEEVNNIYKKISVKSIKTKNIKKELGIYPDVWNKGKSKFNDIRIANYSGENHYLWNPNKISEYDDKFYNPNYRKYLLERQNGKCILCFETNDLCLHHIDGNKRNSNEKNLICVCRSCHSVIHNNFDKMTKKLINEIIKQGVSDGISFKSNNNCGSDTKVSSPIAILG